MCLVFNELIYSCIKNLKNYQCITNILNCSYKALYTLYVILRRYLEVSSNNTHQIETTKWL